MMPIWPKAFIVLLIVVVASGIFLYDSIDNWKTDDQRLPISVIPREYHLKLYPRISEGLFNGNVEINITCLESTFNIMLHAHDSLNIINVQLFSLDVANSTDISIYNISRNASVDTLTITLSNEIQPGNSYQIYIEFSGKLNDPEYHDYSYNRNTFQGFYRTSYKVSRSQEKIWYAATYMAAKYARRVFPCFDEPSFKATFQISVARMINMSTLSVMPLESTEIAEEEGWVWDHFPLTPPLSTFSINLLVSDFTSDTSMNISTKYSNITVYFHHSQNHYLKIGKDNLNLILHMMNYLEDLFEVPYPLPKLDIVSLPEPFGIMKQNAMGLLMYNEQMMQYASLLLVPDLVDQWIGHMVTPEWWNDVNITNILSFYLTRGGLMKAYNKKVWYIIPSNDMYKTFSRSNYSVHSYYQGTMFEPYFTRRGEWFLEMLNYTLSEETFNSGLKNFFSNNLYNTFTEGMFWAALSNQAWNDNALPEPLIVEIIANSWLNKTQHYPVLTVTRKYEQNTASLEQHVFIRELYYNLTEEEKKLFWLIPIKYVTPENMDYNSKYPSTWMGEERCSNITGLPNSNSFIIVNPTDAGMFLVNYDQHNWQLISEYLLNSEHKLPPAMRKKVLQDALFLATGGELDYSTALNMTLFLFSETDYLVWIPFVDILKDLQKYYQWTPVEDKFNLYIRNLLTPMFKSLPSPQYFDYNTEDYATFWYKARERLQAVGYQPYINKTQEELNKIMPTYAMYDNNTELIIFCPEFMRNSSEDWTMYINKLENYMNKINYNLHHFWRKSITKCPGYIELIERILNETLDEEKVFLSSYWKSLVHLITSSPASQNMAFNFFLEHFDEFKQRLFFIRDSWIDFLSALTNKIRTEEGLRKLLEFYNEYEHKLGYSRETVKKSITDVTKAVIWVRDNLPDIEHWFENILPNFS